MLRRTGKGAEARRLADLIVTQERLVDARLKAIALEEAAAFATRFGEKLFSSAPNMEKRIIRSLVSQ